MGLRLEGLIIIPKIMVNQEIVSLKCSARNWVTKSAWLEEDRYKYKTSRSMPWRKRFRSVATSHLSSLRRQFFDSPTSCTMPDEVDDEDARYAARAPVVPWYFLAPSASENARARNRVYGTYNSGH